jgi:hypothetical protein
MSLRSNTIPPPLTRNAPTVLNEVKYDNSLSEVQLEEEIKIIFLSDEQLNKTIIDTFSTFNKRIVEFCEDTFINLTINNIYARKINMLWLNLRNKKCLDWVSKNIKNAKQNNWKIILITKNKNYKFVEDLKPYINDVVNLKQLKKWLISLSFDDFLNNIDEVHISKVPWKFFKCFSLCNKK